MRAEAHSQKECRFLAFVVSLNCFFQQGVVGNIIPNNQIAANIERKQGIPEGAEQPLRAEAQRRSRDACSGAKAPAFGSSR